MTSLIVPSWSPELVWTWAPVSFVARMSWWVMRPVALRPPWCFEDHELPLALDGSLLEEPLRAPLLEPAGSVAEP